MSARRPWQVTTSDGRLRHFGMFEWAERWARKYVAESANERFAVSAEIVGPGKSASVRLDGCNRVWTDFGMFTYFDADGVVIA
jgi:hypothetical protein